MSVVYDFLICLRCHAYELFTLDTIDAIHHYMNRDRVKVVLAIDGERDQYARRMYMHVPKAVYVSQVRWKWGPGLYGLLSEAILWARSRWDFRHFVSMDYDALVIGHGLEDQLLSQIRPSVGLLGEHCPQEIGGCGAVFNRERPQLERTYGPLPGDYRPGEGVQGGFFVMTEQLLAEMSARKMFDPPYRNVCNVSSLPDDKLTALFCRMCGLHPTQIGPYALIRFNLNDTPFRLQHRGVAVFHPTKTVAAQTDVRVKIAREIAVRSYYRRFRGRPPLFDQQEAVLREIEATGS